MASSKSVTDLLKQQTLKEPKLAQLDRVFYKCFTAMLSEGESLLGLC